MRLVDRHDLTVSAASVGETGDRLALRVRLEARIGLERIVEVEIVVLTHVVARINRVLVDRDRGQRGADRTRAGQVVGGRNELEQLLRHRIGHRGALRIGQRSRVHVDALQVAEPLIAAEEEGSILHNGSAEVEAELFSVEQRLGRHVAGRIDAGRIEVVARVELVVAVEVEALAMHRVRARSRGDVHDRAGVAAVLRAERGVVHLEFGHSVDRRLERHLAVRQVVQVDAVEHHVDRGLAVARRHERERPLPAERRAQIRILRRSGAARHQRAEVDEVPAVQRNLLNGPFGHHLTDRDRGGFDERRRAGHGDVFRQRGNAELHVDDGDLSDFEHDLALLVLKTFEVRDHLVAARCQRGSDVLACGIGRGGPFEAGRHIADGDRNAWHHGVLRVRDGSLERGGRLRPYRGNCDRQRDADKGKRAEPEPHSHHPSSARKKSSVQRVKTGPA